MSPEQAAGDRRRLDHRTDLYSLAATLYELLTGRLVFPAEEPAVLVRQIAHDDPLPLRSVEATVPADLETVVLKALNKDPRDRYGTAAEFADDLERFLAGRPVLARRPSAADRARRWAGRHPATVATAVMSLLVVLVASAITAVLTSRAYRAERDRANEAERRFHQTKELSDLVLRISEEEIGMDSPFQGPRRRLLLAALENYRALCADGRDPALLAELDRVRGRVERLLADQAQRREAEAAFLLPIPEVCDELGLSDEQRQCIETILARRSGPGRGPWEPRPSLNLEARSALLDVLSRPQRERLRQIFLQSRGPMAFNEPEVVEALGLTPEQRQQIKVLQAEGFGVFFKLGPPPGQPGTPGPPPFGGLRGGPGVGRGGPPGVVRADGPRFDPEVVSKVVGRILESLTPEQRGAWQAIIGKPFSPSPR
jgi:hypothetical protein